jgi:hypothetical protein
MGLRAQRDLLESLAPKRVLQRVLLIRESDGQAAFNAAKSALDRIGIPYLVVSPTAIPELFRNEAGTNVCNFNSVLFSLGGIVSNEADRQRIADFELTCGAREAVWYTWPTPEFGLQYIDGTASSAYTGVHGYRRRFSGISRILLAREANRQAPGERRVHVPDDCSRCPDDAAVAQ